MKYDDFLKKAVKENAEKIADSQIFCCIISDAYLNNPYCAMQLGLAILLDKPIRLLVKRGVKLPQALEKIADKIEYIANPDDTYAAAKRLLGDIKK